VTAVPFDEGLAKVVAWWRGQRKGVACA